MSQPGQPARRAALAILDSVLNDQRLLVDTDTRHPALKQLSPAETARARRLAMDTLRWMDRADRLLGRYLRKMPPLPVMNILRLSAVEICQLSEAPHGVVHDAVSLARSTRGMGKLAGLVNATLRKVAVDGPDLWVTLPLPQLPKWLRKQLIAIYGKAVVMQIESAHSRAAPLDLTPKDGNVDHLAELTGGIALPSGSVRLGNPGQVSELPGYSGGDWWVQDAAAAMPVQLLNPRPQEQILDLCAAPGGKTMQIAAAGAEVVALDQSAERLKRVHENLARTKLSATVTHGDALNHTGIYHAILLDAPCSATGTIRRHPDLPHLKSQGDADDLTAIQAKLMDHAGTLLRDGGRMVYCTCSLLPQEGEVQVTEFLARHPEFTVAPVHLPWIEQDWITPEGGIRLRPDYWADQGGMDGFYMACLRKS